MKGEASGLGRHVDRASCARVYADEVICQEYLSQQLPRPSGSRRNFFWSNNKIELMETLAIVDEMHAAAPFHGDEVVPETGIAHNIRNSFL